MNTQHIFAPRTNGSISFRQTTIKLNDENNITIKSGLNSLKGGVVVPEDSHREFTGKDITNLTVQNSENVNPNSRRSFDVGVKENKTLTSFYANKKPLNVVKEENHSISVNPLNKYKNYNLRNRAQTTKTVNEAIVQARREHSNSILVPSSALLNSTIVNNEMEEEMIVEEEELVKKMDESDFSCSRGMNEMMLTDEDATLKPETILNPRPQLCEDYIPEIFEHLKAVEFDFLPSDCYMKNQSDINEKMRGILVDWLVEVHLKFKLLPETLFLTVNLIDRFLEIRHIMRNRLQLVGVTAMLIACKYEEIYAPEVRDFVYITDKAYTKEEILQMENEMLAALQYNITVPSSFRYLEVYNYFLKLEESAFVFCRYLLELFLVDYKMLKYNPSLLASASLYITIKITKKGDVEKITALTEYSEEKLRECAKDICLILDNVEKSTLQAVRKKFSLAKFLEVAKIKFN